MQAPVPSPRASALRVPGATPIFPSMQIAYLDGPRLRRALVAACEYAQLVRGELNRINVFPVPDGDTGTNLALTVRAISDHLEKNQDRDVSAVAHQAAQAAILGARGNCGMMLSHFLLGFACGVEGAERVDANEFSEALRLGVRRLYEAIEAPVEGTILTVMRETSEAADQATIHDFAPLVEHLLDAAESSLERTPELLPALKSAGVVDAGGKGFVALLEGVACFLRGDPIVPAEDGAFDSPPVVAEVEYPEIVERFRFCTEGLVRGPEIPSQAELRGVLREMGDSLIVVRSEDIAKVHVHTDDPEEVFAYLRGLGTLVTHKAEDMRAQHAAVEKAATSHVTLARRPVGVVTDSASDLSEEIVRAHGIQVVPLMLVTDEAVYRDGVDITATEFHELLEGQDAVPTTSQPPPGAYLEGFTRAAQDAERVVGIILGSSLSGSFASAEAAAKMVDGASVTLVDTLAASLLQGLLVLKATELAEMAVEPEAIVREIERVRGQSGLMFTVDTFERLVASGRVGRGHALVGTVLNVKPVLELDTSGKVVPVTKTVGRRRVMAALLEAVAERVGPGASKVRFGVVHVGCPQVLDEVSEMLRERYGADAEILTAPATPVISTHLGIGAWGVAYLVED